MSEKLFEVAAMGEEEREEGAQALIAAFIDRARVLGFQPPGRFVKILGQQIRELLAEGQPREHVELALLLMADKGERPSDLPFLLPKAVRQGERAALSSFVTEYGWPTGCRFVRGSHGGAEIYDPLGTDRLPSGWPHERPGRPEVEDAVKALTALGDFLTSS